MRVCRTALHDQFEPISGVRPVMPRRRAPTARSEESPLRLREFDPVDGLFPSRFFDGLLPPHVFDTPTQKSRWEFTRGVRQRRPSDRTTDPIHGALRTCSNNYSIFMLFWSRAGWKNSKQLKL